MTHFLRRVFPFRGPNRKKIIFFIICFYAIMHRTTIVQDKIISSICSCVFFCPANIYRPSLGKVWLGRPNPKLIPLLNFYLGRRRKKTILLRIVCTTMVQSTILNFGDDTIMSSVKTKCWLQWWQCWVQWVQWWHSVDNKLMISDNKLMNLYEVCLFHIVRGVSKGTRDNYHEIWWK